LQIVVSEIISELPQRGSQSGLVHTTNSVQSVPLTYQHIRSIPAPFVSQEGLAHIARNKGGAVALKVIPDVVIDVAPLLQQCCRQCCCHGHCCITALVVVSAYEGSTHSSCLFNNIIKNCAIARIKVSQIWQSFSCRQEHLADIDICSKGFPQG
jgi:hypothetical protein